MRAGLGLQDGRACARHGYLNYIPANEVALFYQAH